MKIISVGRIVIAIGLSKSGLWSTTKPNKEKVIYLFSLHLLRKNNLNAVSCILFPLTITIGIASCNDNEKCYCCKELNNIKDMKLTDDDYWLCQKCYNDL